MLKCVMHAAAMVMLNSVAAAAEPARANDLRPCISKYSAQSLYLHYLLPPGSSVYKMNQDLQRI